MEKQEASLRQAAGRTAAPQWKLALAEKVPTRFFLHCRLLFLVLSIKQTSTILPFKSDRSCTIAYVRAGRRGSQCASAVSGQSL